MERFWEDKKVLVTGANGFLGTYVTDLLYEAGCRRMFFHRHIDYDLTDINDIKKMFGYFQPDIVIHLAANVGGIGYNQNNPASLYYDNIMMGTQLMHEAYKNDVKKFVALGTVCAYPKYTPVPFKEESLWDGYPEETNAPYGLAKKMLLVQSQAYRDQYGFNSIYLLPVNLYGPGDNFKDDSSHVIPALIKKIYLAKTNNEPLVEIWGSGKPTREFLYVEDAAKGIIRAAEVYNDREPINLGTGKEYSIGYIAKQIASIMKYEGKFKFNLNKPDGQPRRVLDVSRAKQLLNWEAVMPLEEGLERTIEYYEESSK